MVQQDFVYNLMNYFQNDVHKHESDKIRQMSGKKKRKKTKYTIYFFFCTCG